MEPRNCPSPEQLQEALQSELEVRRKCFPHLDCQGVLRLGGFIGSGIECHAALERAMLRARQHITEVELAGGSVESGRVILADTMTSAKGRFTRSWHAPGGGVWGCLVHACTLLPWSRSYVPLAVGAACCETLHHFGVTDAELRWVNDVLVAGQKIAGFLIEGFHGPVHRETFNLIGFGINLNNTSFPDELAGMATSASSVLGQELEPSLFTAVFLAKLTWYFGLLHHEEAVQLAEERFSGRDGEHLVLTGWRQLSTTIGRKVRYGFDVVREPLYEAKVVGLAPDGGLLLEFADGSVKTEHSGEIRYL